MQSKQRSDGVTIQGLQSIQADYLEQMGKLLTQPERAIEIIKQDARFAGANWQTPGAFSYSAAIYALNRRAFLAMAESADLPAKEKMQLQFLVEQFVEASSPANFLATNPEAQSELLQTSG